jgi:hypothetical protein
MDLALGVAVAGPVARLALIESGAHSVIDESVVDLAVDPIEKLTETVVGTNRLLADQDHRLVATRLCWSDLRRAGQLRQALDDSGVQNVAVLSAEQAAMALARNLSGAQGQRGSAVLLLDDQTAKLSILGADGVTAKAVGAEPLDGSDAVTVAGTLLGRLGEEPGGADGVYVIGTSSDATAVVDELRARSSLPLEVPDDPEFAIARGAAMAAETAGMSDLAMPAGEPTMAAPAATLAAGEATMAGLSMPTEEPTMAAAAAPMTEAAMTAGELTTNEPAATGSTPQLAYAMEDYDSQLLPMDYDEGDEGEEPEAAAPPVGRALLVGSSVGGILVAGCAALAVAVTISLRPTAATRPQQPVPAQQKSVPGNFMPALPAPNAPVSPPVQAPSAPAPAPEVPPSVSGPVPQVGGGAPGGAPPAPAGPPDVGPPNVGPSVAPPPAPGYNPVPIPIPIPIPINPGSPGGTTQGPGGTIGTTGGTTGTTSGTTGATTGGTSGGTTGGTTGTTGGTTGGGTTGGGTTGGGTTGGGTTGGGTTGGGTTGGGTTGGGTTGGGTTSGGTTSGGTTGGGTTGGGATGGTTGHGGHHF